MVDLTMVLNQQEVIMTTQNPPLFLTLPNKMNKYQARDE